MSNGPLAGVRVFDLTMWMVGPWCSVQLGALGAEVVHIEQPDVDWSTLGAGVPPLINGTSVGYIAWNMNKRGLSLGMKSPEDRTVAYELLKTSDVFLINMTPGVADRLGVGYDIVSGINPQIVYCAITGWGESGPMALLPGADTPAQYVTGFATGTGVPDGDDEINRHFTQMDATSGNYAAQAILMGLLARKRTGKGQRIHVSMLRAGSALQSVRIGEYLAALTSRIELVTAVIILPQRQTALLAKQAAQVDVLSGGRLRLGIGIGWNDVEYEALNENFHDRGKRSEEQVELLRALWTNEIVDFQGRWHSIPGAGIKPLPVQRPIPVWFGGGRSDGVLRRIARMGDGWFPQLQADEQGRERMAAFRNFVAEAGRSQDDVGVDARVALSRGGVDGALRDADAWREMGASHVSFNTLRAGLASADEHIDALRRFKEAAG